MTMKSWRADEFGTPSKTLKLQEVAIPEPSAGMMVVRVAAFGVGLPDVMMLRGVYPLVPKPPVSPGQELVGIVTAVADGSRFAVGDRVMGSAQFTDAHGSFSQYCLMPEIKASIAPKSLSDEQAAGFMIPYKTAYAALSSRCNLKTGETLLVLGASGSCGSAAIQLGKAIGAEVIGVASNDEKMAFCKDQGADHVLNYRTADIASAVRDLTDGKGVNVIFDPVGGEVAETAVKAIAREGRFALLGFASGRWPVLDPLDMVLRSYSAVGIFSADFGSEEGSIECFDALCDLAERGKITTPVAKVFGFKNAREALDMIENNSPCGKLVVSNL